MRECQAVGCDNDAPTGVFCTEHLRRDLEAVRTGLPRVPRKREADMRPEDNQTCRRCGKPASVDSRFSRRSGLCKSCSTTIAKCRRLGKEVPPPATRNWEKEEQGRQGPEPEPVCAECGRPASALKRFISSKGLHESCSKRRKRNTQAAGERPAKENPAGAARTTDIRIRPSDDTPALLIDFSAYPDIYEELVEWARDEMRPPEMQVLYILRRLQEIGKEALDR